MTQTRRDALKRGGLAAVGAAGVLVLLGSAALQAKSVSTLPAALFPRRYVRDLIIPPVFEATEADGVRMYVPGPIVSVVKGEPASITMGNHLPSVNSMGGCDDFSTHLHGSESLPDGGLTASHHLQDEDEQPLLPQGRFDVPLTVTDAIFNADGSLAYLDNSHSGVGRRGAPRLSGSGSAATPW